MITPHRITRKRLLVLAGLSIVILLGLSWQLGWFQREPSHNGRTVTEWLDSLALYTKVTQPNGDIVMVYRSTDEMVADPAFQALQAIGSRAVPVLIKRIAEPADYPDGMSRSGRWMTRLQWTWYRLRGPKATRPVSAGWPRIQIDRKTAAAFMLVALGTNGHGGFPRLMETYAAAPRFTSVYGAKLAGAPVGFAPSASMRFAWYACPQLREEIVAGVMSGLQHTNAMCQSMAVDCTAEIPELRHIFVEARQGAK